MTYKDKHIAQDAAKNAFTHIEPQAARVFHFCLMHNGSPKNDPNYQLAEAMNAASEFDQHRMMLEFASAYCKENHIDWKGIEILGKATKYGHFRECDYHYTFRALVFLDDIETRYESEDDNNEAQ